MIVGMSALLFTLVMLVPRVETDAIFYGRHMAERSFSILPEHIFVIEMPINKEGDLSFF